MAQAPLPVNVALTSPTGTPANARTPLRANNQGAMTVNQLGGEKYPMVLDGTLYDGANQAGATLSAGLATTYTGLCLSNPAGSLKNLFVRQVAVTIAIAPAAFLALGFITGWAAGGITVHTTPLVPRPGNVGRPSASVANIDAACTLVGAGAFAPAFSQWLTSNYNTAGGAWTSIDMQAGFMVPPGGYVAIGANVAGPASGFFGSFEWLEI